MTVAYKTWPMKDGVLHCGDCLKVMAAMDTGAVDLVFGSPPYEDARLYLEAGEDLKIARKTAAWVEWMVEVYRASLRVCSGLVAYVVGHGKGAKTWSGAPALLCADLIRAGVNLRSPAWYYRSGIMGSGGPDWLRADLEWIICAGPRDLPWSDNTACGHPPKYAPGGEMSNRTRNGARVNQWGHNGGPRAKMRRKDGSWAGSTQPSHKQVSVYDGVTRANPGNVITCTVGGGHMGSALAHEGEAPFPEKLPDFFVRSFCRPGGTVLDPFCGTGTTLATAVKHGRRYVGIDLRPSQIEISRRRIKQARLRRGLKR